MAVLLMILGHTADAWTRGADRESAAFGRALLMSGFAAPLFLWLAGVGMAMSAGKVTRLEGRGAAVRAVVRRGLELFILAFLFRLQAFIVSPGSHPVTIFRVDILNVMGPAVAVAGLVWALGSRQGGHVSRVAAYGAAAIFVALLTPLVATMGVVDLLPLGLQWYVRPAGDLTTFTLFPWAGFVFAGAASGVLLARARNAGAEGRLQSTFAAAGLALVAAVHYLSTQPSLYPESSFWTTSPTWFAMRVGILMPAVAAMYALGAMASRRDWSLPALERFGRSSLFVYWVHVELVYGYATWPLHNTLPVWASLAGCAVFAALMFGAIALRDRVLEYWRSRPARQGAPQAATA
jgi:uncharacterized membrane protein